MLSSGLFRAYQIHSDSFTLIVIAFANVSSICLFLEEKQLSLLLFHSNAITSYNNTAICLAHVCQIEHFCFFLRLFVELSKCDSSYRSCSNKHTNKTSSYKYSGGDVYIVMFLTHCTGFGGTNMLLWLS